MAVYVKYRQVAQDVGSVTYEIHTAPADPSPIAVRFFTAPRAPVPVVSGPKVAANRAIRQILARSRAEDAWPAGGVIQS